MPRTLIEDPGPDLVVARFEEAIALFNDHGDRNCCGPGGEQRPGQWMYNYLWDNERGFCRDVLDGRRLDVGPLL